MIVKLFIGIIIILIIPSFIISKDIDLSDIIKFIEIKRVIKFHNKNTMDDYKTLINFMDTILNSPNSINEPWEFDKYFEELGYTFYKYINWGPPSGSYRIYIAIKDSNVYYIENPEKFINQILPKISIKDSILLPILANIYNKLYFYNMNVDFIDKYDKTIHPSKDYFDLHYNVFLSDRKNKLGYLKVYNKFEGSMAYEFNISYWLGDKIFYVDNKLMFACPGSGFYERINKKFKKIR